MDLQLKGRTALITGGSRGIGFGVAQLLAAEGCNLHLASRSAADLEAARGKITAACAVNVTCHAFDLSVAENSVRLARECGEIDILVNNAGAIPQGAITDFDDQTWRAAWIARAPYSPSTSSSRRLLRSATICRSSQVAVRFQARPDLRSEKSTRSRR